MFNIFTIQNHICGTKNKCKTNPKRGEEEIKVVTPNEVEKKGKKVLKYTHTYMEKE